MKHLNKAPGEGEAGEKVDSVDAALSPDLQVRYKDITARLAQMKEQILSGEVDLSKIKTGNPFALDLGEFNFELSEAIRESAEFRALRHRSVMGEGSGLLPSIRLSGDQTRIEFQILTADDIQKPTINDHVSDAYRTDAKKQPFPEDKLKLPDDAKLKPPEGGLL